MRILDRYIVLAFIKNYIIAMGVLIGMYIVMDMVFHFDELAKTEMSSNSGVLASALAVLSNIVENYSYQVFPIFTSLAPIIPGVAAGFTLIRMSRSNELVAILAAGVPLLRVAAPMVIAAVLLMSIVIVNQELIIPPMAPQLMRKHGQISSDKGQEWFVAAMPDTRSNAFVTAGRFLAENKTRPATLDLLHVVMRNEDGLATAHLYADHATWEEGRDRWLLTNGWIVRGLADNNPRQEAIQYYANGVTPEQIMIAKRASMVELLSTSQINQMLEDRNAYGATDLLRVKHSRWAQVPINIILLLLTIPCVLTREPGQLKGGVVNAGLLTVACMALVFFMHNLAGKAAMFGNPDLWAALMTFIPVFIFGPLAVYLLLKIKT